MPETPPEALGPTVRLEVAIAGRTFMLSRPDAVDRLIDHPVLGASSAVDEYMPYWADLWPAARLLAQAILTEPWSGPLHALEIGCGLGLPGIAALARGLRVTFSDYDSTSLRFAAANARLNGFENFDVLELDWRNPPEGLQVPVLLAADVAYDVQVFPPLAALIRRVLAPNGVCLLADGDRAHAHVLRDAFTNERLTFTQDRMRVESPGLRPAEGTLYRITCPDKLER